MEEALPPMTEEEVGFESPTVRQFTIFLENHVGRLQALVRALEEEADPIRAIAIEESADSALVRLVCADPEVARQTLQMAGFAHSESDILAVASPKDLKRPLSAICSALLAAEINIHYVYPFLFTPIGPALAMYVDDTTLAARLLIRKGFTLVGASDLRK